MGFCPFVVKLGGEAHNRRFVASAVEMEAVLETSKSEPRGKVFELFLNLKQIKKICMKNFTTYLSTAPVVALVWFTITAALLIEINRFFPDPLVFSF
jgi:photosystem I subunit 9